MTQSGGPEAFDTYKAEEAPNFLAGFDAVQNPDAWGEATKMMQLNNKQRLANAKLGEKAVAKVTKMSPTLGKLWKQDYDKKEEVFKNRATLLANKIGANQEAMTLYQRENEDNIQAVGYFESLALEQEEKGTPEGYDLAKEIRALHGRGMYHMKETLAREQALSAKRDFYNDLPELRMEDPNVEGSWLTWDEADNSEKKLLWDHWLENQGLNNVNGLDDKFLADNYWKFVNRERDAILNEAAETDYVNSERERADGYLNQFALAANTDNLGSKFLEVIELTRGKYKDSRGQPSTKLARKAVIETLDQMLTDEKITPEQYTRLLETEIKNRSTGKMQSVGSIWAKDFGNVEDRIQTAIKKRGDVEERRRDNLRNEAGNAALKAVEENNGYISEAEVAELIKAWKANPETAGIPIPDQYETLKSNTVEDKSDAQYAEILQAREDQGLPLGTLWTRIKDEDMRKEWSEKARLDGETTNARSAAISQIGRMIDTHKSNQLGVAGRDDNWGITYRNSLQSYRKHYRDAAAIFPGDPYKRQEYALGQVKQELDNVNDEGASVLDIRKPLEINQQYKVNNQKALSAIINGNKTGTNVLTSGQIIPGTEEDFKVLESMNKNTSIVDVPARYYYLASRLKVPNGKGGYLDGWGLAALQYKSVTGKDLKLPGPIENLYKKSAIIQTLLNPKGLTINRYNRGKVIDKNGGDFSQPETLNPLLQPAIG